MGACVCVCVCRFTIYRQFKEMTNSKQRINGKTMKIIKTDRNRSICGALTCERVAKTIFFMINDFGVHILFLWAVHYSFFLLLQRLHVMIFRGNNKHAITENV